METNRADYRSMACDACKRKLIVDKKREVMWCENSDCSEVGVWFKTPERIEKEGEAVTRLIFQFAPPFSRHWR